MYTYSTIILYAYMYEHMRHVGTGAGRMSLFIPVATFVVPATVSTVDSTSPVDKIIL